MKRYPEYQLFEGNWLSSIPATWKQFRGKILFHDIDKRSETGEEELLTVSHITGVTPRKEKNVTMFKAESLEGYKLCEVGDFASNTMWMWMGAIGVSKYSGLVSPSYNVYRQKNFDYLPEYLEYLLREPNLVAEYRRHSTGVRPSRLRLYPDKFLNIVFPLPSLGEQKAIADFLDKKTEQIDRFISLQKEAISLLKELRQAEITKAVTKGLDENAEMKDSGVEWIGEISSNYTVRRLKYLLNEPLMYGANETGISYDVTLPRYIRITDITLDGKLKGEDKLSLSEDIAYPYLLKNNDVLFARSGGTVGKAFIYKSEYGRSAFAGYLIKASTNEHLLPDYLYYYTQSSLYEEWKNQVFILATIQNIGADKYGNLPIIWQPINEQQKHVDYLNKKCAEIDSAIQNKEALIEKVTEYKTRLISDAVTGNIDVRGEDIKPEL